MPDAQHMADGDIIVLARKSASLEHQAPSIRRITGDAL
jgi:hypothetical protein